MMMSSIFDAVGHVARLPLFLALVAISPPAALAQSEGEAARPPASVIVAPAQRGEMVDRIEALGTTRANESVGITSSVTDIVQELLFDDGQTVEAGAILAILDKAEEEAELRASQAILSERRLAFQRAQELESRQFAATAQLDERRAALLEAEADIQAIEARIANRVILAPFGGVVGIRDISPGALVEPGDLITTLDDLSVIKLDFSVPAVYLPTLVRGLPIVAKASAFGGREFTGEISSIGSRVDPVTRSITARALIPNPEETLRPGLLMTVELLKNVRRSLIIPEEAVIPRGRQTQVMVVDPETETAESREVDLGARRPGAVEVLNGLEEGELVVTHGALQVAPGQRVTIEAMETGNEPLSELLGVATDG
ncbi:efflux RND transporter periplasmic adaptor subunit [Algihabitans albus]|uniref:efflux RND transporter periplasmic adaptor subunit n=1 Tax=Algihabitans albus TaxID=2164067 RepID=UPI000E5CC6EE|nr:efflux RND transporter periplasmic adaptor subunit [Algihabitans albus]